MSRAVAEYSTSPKLGLRHGFFTSRGGVSQGEWAGLNATTRFGDTYEAVAANRDIAMRQLNFQPTQLAFLDGLVSGSKILDATSAAAGKDFDGYDAIMTADPQIVIGLAVADCLPIIIASEQEAVVAIAHAGWRGLIEQVIAKTVVAMSEHHRADPAHITAVIGQGIDVAHYEFGEEAYELFDARYIQVFDEKPHIDLKLMAQDQLAEIGVGCVDDLNIDTYTDNRFYSARRSGRATGRNIVLASL